MSARTKTVADLEAQIGQLEMEKKNLLQLVREQAERIEELENGEDPHFADDDDDLDDWDDEDDYDFDDEE